MVFCRSLNGRYVHICFNISFGRSVIVVRWLSLGIDAGCFRFAALAYPFLRFTCSCSRACAALVPLCFASESITSHPSLFNAGSVGVACFGCMSPLPLLLKYRARRPMRPCSPSMLFSFSHGKLRSSSACSSLSMYAFNTMRP